MCPGIRGHSSTLYKYLVRYSYIAKMAIFKGMLALCRAPTISWANILFENRKKINIARGRWKEQRRNNQNHIFSEVKINTALLYIIKNLIQENFQKQNINKVTRHIV